MHPHPAPLHDDTVELFLPDAAAGGATRPGPAAGAPEPSPVFVDTSGRRQRRLRRWGYLLVVPAVGYVALLVSALLGGPTVQAPFLPSARAPQTPAPGPAPTSADATRSATSGAPRPDSTTGGDTAASPTPGATTPAAGRASTTPPASGRTTAPTATAGATSKPTPPGAGAGKPTAPPGQGGGKPTSHP
ncbi:hypothetical protein [Streptomyces sp. NPDC053431]|uniref:hypothetical protein n=1 Tax=Streptomyces sp. NPDC053431 TaxID=3365703 RepID=UPI0037CE5148